MPDTTNPRDEELRNSVYEIVEHWVKGHDTGTQGVMYTSGNITSSILDLIHTHDATRERDGIKAAELQAQANVYYEAADWCKEDPRYYKHFWNKRKETLAELTTLETKQQTGEK